MPEYPYNATLNAGPMPRDSWKDPARTDRTVAAMLAVIHSTDKTGWVRTLAEKIRAQVPPETKVGDYMSPDQVQAFYKGLSPNAMGPLKIYLFLRRVMDFARDPQGAELVRHPDQLIAEYERTGRMHGDCDDLACLGAALVRALGFPALLIVAGRKADGPFEHVYYGAEIAGRQVPFDPQEKIPPGRERAVQRRKVYTV